ncbi:histone-lysine N-methyltransferase SETMAR [Trichonephila clavipes]|uniref:Histone-lysine N-methyltransferase SETMAR n=1 Tax=Trichonephila clavipes TaxID=2585209 RepID=A0A8X6RLY8_TRICX|nr:histone-lysine N-methyltransferase SETMAR [Trichonephila clavipes]
MFKTIDQPADCEIWSVIRFLTAKNVSAAEIHRQISDVYGPNAMSSSKVHKWVRAFKDGRKNVHDEPRSGRPSVITDDLVKAVDEKIREDRRFTISTLALEFPNVGRTTLHKVVSEKLKFRKLCARWVPRLLTEEHKLKIMVCALDFLDRYHKEGDKFLERIVTGDETWVSHITPESKRQSMEWRHTNSPVRVKAKRIISTRKVMATVFWDRHGVLLVEFMQQGTTINAAAYCATLTKLRRAIQNKRRGLLTSGVVLLHDNASPHSAINIQNLIRSFGWEPIDHPPYSRDMAQSDFHLFRYLKEFLGGKRFDTADEVKEEVQDWLSSQAADVYEVGIQKLVERYDKCLDKHGKYVEK